MTPSDLKAAVRHYARKRGADLVGFVAADHLNRVTPTGLTPERLWPEARAAISIGKRILMGAIAVGTGDSVQNARWAAWRTNEFLNRRAMEVAYFVEEHGARALPLSNGTMIDPTWRNLGIFGELSHRHIAAEAGLGTIGVPTFIVTPRFGPRVYFNTILTDAELEPDPKLDFDPCGTDCGECIRACPSGAIQRGRKTIKKTLCIPNAMPHGVAALRKYAQGLFDAADAEERKARLDDFDFARLHRALVQGVGTIAGCFHCLAACPVGKETFAKGETAPETSSPKGGRGA